MQARGYDQTHISALEPESLRRALSAAVRALLREGAGAGLPTVDAVRERLAGLP